MSEYNILFTIIAILFSILFLSIGIYQLRHPDKIIGKEKKSIERPVAVGSAMIMCAIASAISAANCFFTGPNFQTNEDIFYDILSITNAVGIIAFSGTLIALGSIGLMKKNIITFKNTPAMRKYHQKYQKFYNISIIVFAAAMIFVYLVMPNLLLFEDLALSQPNLFTAIYLVPAILCLPIVIISIIIECSFIRKK